MLRGLSPAASLSLALVAGVLMKLLLFARARARAAQSLRACGLSATFWRPRLGAWLRPPYSSSPRNLLQAVRARCAQAADGLNAYGAPRRRHVSRLSRRRRRLRRRSHALLLFAQAW